MHGKQDSQRKKMTFEWHVEDLKISHDNGDTVDALIIKRSEKYGKEADLTIHRDILHEYLCMKLDYHEQGKEKIYMTDYLKIMDGLTDKYQGRAITLATNHLFGFNETACKLSEKGSQDFHTIVPNYYPN